MRGGAAKALLQALPLFLSLRCGRGCRRVPIDNYASSPSIIALADRRSQYDTPTPPWSRAEGSDRSGARTPRVSKRRKGGSQMGFVRSKNKPMKLLQI